MEDNYASIVYVELKNKIFIPNEWPIQGIENLVLFLAEKIMIHPGSITPILQTKNIPAKLVRCHTTSGVIYIFQKMSPEEVVGAYLYDVVLPADDHSIKIDMTSGINKCSGPWPNYSVNASPKAKRMIYHVMPRRFKTFVPVPKRSYTSALKPSSMVAVTYVMQRQRQATAYYSS